MEKINFVKNKTELVENLIEVIGKDFLSLENNSQQIVNSIDSAIESQEINKEGREYLNGLKISLEKVLKKTAEKTLSVLKKGVIYGAIVTTYVATDLDVKEKFSEKETAKSELLRDGITKDQKLSAYKPGVSELLYRGIMPFGYQNGADPNGPAYDFFSKLEDFNIPNIGLFQNIGKNLIVGREVFGNEHRREDAWRVYLGLPQKENTFGISDFKPSKETDNKFYFKINNFWQEYINENGDLDSFKIGMFSKESVQEQEDVSVITQNKKSYRTYNTDVMGNYTFGISHDEKGTYLYYYDKWDLASALVENPVAQGVGKAYEIYDRLYFDPVTMKILN